MELLKDRVLVINLLIIMVILSFAYIVYISITMVLMVDELKTVNNTYVTVIVYAAPEVKGVTSEQPKTKTIIDKPKVIVKVPEPKPAVKEKPKVITKTPEPKPVVAKMDNDTYLLAQIIDAEAKGEPYNGKVAVGNVILNRVNSPDFPNTVKEVIFQKGQFSPVNNGSIHDTPSEDSIKAARAVMNGKKVVSNQALYFYNPNTSTSEWIFSRKTLMDIGNHRFAY